MATIDRSSSRSTKLNRKAHSEQVTVDVQRNDEGWNTGLIVTRAK